MENKNGGILWEGINALAKYLPLAMAFLPAYMVELGFSGHFGFSRDLIAIDWLDLVPALGTVATYASIAAIAHFVPAWLRPSMPQTGARLKKGTASFLMAAMTFALLSAWMFFFLPSSWSPLWSSFWHGHDPYVWTTGVLVLLIFFRLHWVLLTPASDVDPSEARRQAAERALYGRGLTGSQKATVALATIVMVGALLIWLPWYTGDLEAKTQKDFWVPSTHQDLVVLRIYGDRLVCGQTVEKAEGVYQLTDNFSVITLNDNPGMVLRLEKRGPL